MKTVGVDTPRVDGKALVRGKPVFTDDVDIPGQLYIKILYSPVPHARIKQINVQSVLDLEGVVLVLTHKDFPKHYYTTAGQGYPEPSPRDFLILNPVVRFTGDRVAVVAAETLETASEALKLIDVEYEPLPTVFDPELSIDNETVLHPDISDDPFLFDAKRNIASRIEANLGEPEKVLRNSEFTFSETYQTPYVHQGYIEPHITLTWLDEHDRLVIRTSTQVPFHVRRIVAEVLDIPIARIRVIKPRIGGGFGGKQEILNEEICSAVTLKTGRPARIQMTREEEFFAARPRHPQKIRLNLGIDSQHRIQAIDADILENCGAHGPHALTVMSVAAQKMMSMYSIDNINLIGNAVYTNLPVAGAYRGYGAPQGFFALECMMDEIACQLNLDPIEFRRQNLFSEGSEIPIARILGEGREGYETILRSTGMSECLDLGRELIDWDRRRTDHGEGHERKGVGLACACQGSGIPGIDMASTFIKMNEDGSFNLQMGATDLGTGSDTALAQIAAEVLEVPMEKIIVYSSDTDLTPFDPGAYASSTTYVSGGAVKKAAESLKAKILAQGCKLLTSESGVIANQQVTAPDGASISYSEICTRSFYTDHQVQLMATASHMSYDSPPPFNATFAAVTVDTETGIVRVKKVVSVTDAGKIINPRLAEGQVEGGIPQALGMALSEYMQFTEDGSTVNLDFLDYHMYTAEDMPELVVKFIETHEPTGPFGAKAVAEIPIDAPAPAVANAIFNACGARIRECPITPEAVLKALGKI